MARAERKIWVKGDPGTDTLGDCPFSHRALLMLELKVWLARTVLRRCCSAHVPLCTGFRQGRKPAGP